MRQGNWNSPSRRSAQTGTRATGYKWFFTPRGCAFLWAQRDRQGDLHPLAISHGYGKGFSEEFDWPGTRDFSPWLGVTAGLSFMEKLGAGAIRRYCHGLVLDAAERISAPAASRTSSHARLDDGDPAAGYAADRKRYARGCAQTSVGVHGEAPHRRSDHAHRRCLVGRISAQISNSAEDYERLVQAAQR